MIKHYRPISLVLILSLLLTACGVFGAVLQEARSLAAFESDAGAAVQTTETPVTPEPELFTDLPPAAGALEELQQAFTRVYEGINLSVVNIQVIRVQRAPASVIPFIPNPPFNAPEPQEPQPFRTASLGSGFVWDQDGHIVTNNHVVDGATEIRVTFSDGATVEAELVGADPDSDLAVVRVDRPADRLKPVQLADSTQVKVGQLAIAVGNPFGLQGSMTVGVISALGRSLPVAGDTITGPTYTIPDVIQTDAPINPGNSGGVLVDIHGRLIGVPTAIESPVRASAGIGFVIPSIIVQKVVPALIAQGFYEHPWIGFSGVTMNSILAREMGLDEGRRGALVIDVVPHSPAEAAGLRGSDRVVTLDGQEVRLGGDIIIQIDDQPVDDFEDLVAYLARYASVGDTITLTVLREGEPVELTVTLGAREGRRPDATPLSGPVWLGIQGLTLSPQLAEAMGLDPDQRGVLVEQVFQGSPADRAGLRGSYKAVTIGGERVLIGGDVIVALDGQPIGSMVDLQSALQNRRPGEVVTLIILREGVERQIEVELAVRSAAPAP